MYWPTSWVVYDVIYVYMFYFSMLSGGCCSPGGGRSVTGVGLDCSPGAVGLLLLLV